MDEKDKAMNELNKKMVNRHWCLGILVFIIIELLAFIFYKSKNEGIEIGDLISISSGLVSIALGLVAIILAISQNNQATTKEGNANNILEQIKARVHTVGEDTKKIQSKLERLGKGAEIKKASFDRNRITDMEYVDISGNKEIDKKEEKMKNEDETQKDESQKDETQKGETQKDESQKDESQKDETQKDESQKGELKSNKILESEIMYNKLMIKTKLVKRGDIFFADLSKNVGSEQGGIRPVVIVQNNIGNKYSPIVTIVPASLQINKAKLPTHVEISSIKYGLTKDAVILTEQIRCIDKTRLKEKIGVLSDSDLTKVDEALLIQLGIV